MAAPGRIGSYTVIRRLAKGGMAEVFLAERGGPEQFKKRVALKRLLRPLSAQPSFVTMFLDEARLVARLNHPNVAQLYELGDDDGQYFVAMEYVHGRNLADLLDACTAAGRMFPLYVAAKIVSAACEGLHYAHEFEDEAGVPLKVIHRDVSPQNVMLSYDGVVKVVDFGIAKAAVNYYQTQVGSLKGKLDYMSPEQVQQNVLLDRRTDVYSLGAVLYELLSGRRPFDRNSDLAVMSAIVREPPGELTLPEPEKNGELARIALKALAKDRSQRFETAREMGAALERFLMARGELVDAERLAACVRELAPPDEPLDTTGTVSETAPVPRPEVTEKVSALPDDSSTQPLTPKPGPRQAPALAVPPAVRRRWVGGAVAVALVVGGVVIARNHFQPSPKPPGPAATAPLVAASPRAVPPPTTPRSDEPQPTTAAPVDAPVALRDLDPEPPRPGESASRRGLLVVRTEPPTDAWVDGRLALAATLAGMELKPGPHTVTLVNAALGIRLKQQVQLKRGRTTTVNKRIQKGDLLVFVTPYGRVFVDDKDYGLTPLDAPVVLYEGEHTLRVVCDRTAQENVQPVQISPGVTLRLKVDLR